ncbi:MAG: phage terminase large subunit [Candidatus Obscuribacterales bacterium]|nr:phage terminase large subunit [Candidatus Obscuribacterales bacterium]
MPKSANPKKNYVEKPLASKESEVEIIAPQLGPQSLLLQCPYKEIMYGGARGGGKSAGACLDWHKHAMTWKVNARGIVIRRTYPELEQFRDTAMQLLSKLGWIWRAGERVFKHPNGAVLKLRFLEQDRHADHYQGHEYTWLCVEEAGNFPDPAPLKKMKATLRSAAGVKTRMLYTANPGGRGHDWLKEYFINPAPEGLTAIRDPKTKQLRMFIPSKLEDNAILMNADPDYANNLEGTGPSWLVKAWRHGDWNVAPSGNVFKREWWKSYRTPPSDFIRIIQSWDTAFKKGPENDRSACTTWGVGALGYYLLDAWADRVEYPELKKQAVMLNAKWNPHAVYVEDKASGQSLIQELKRETAVPVIAVNVDSDKYSRACAVSAIIEAGRCFIPEDAPWIADYLEELSRFPTASNDDYVDSTSQALNRMAHFRRSLEKYQSNVVQFKGSIFAR